LCETDLDFEGSYVHNYHAGEAGRGTYCELCAIRLLLQSNGHLTMEDIGTDLIQQVLTRTAEEEAGLAADAANPKPPMDPAALQAMIGEIAELVEEARDENRGLRRLRERDEL
jgi:hypothetical protein